MTIVMSREGLRKDSRELCFLHVTSEDGEDMFFYFDKHKQATNLFCMLTGVAPDSTMLDNWTTKQADVKVFGAFVDGGPVMSVHVGLVGGG